MNTSVRPLVFINEKVAKKIFKNEKYGKIFSAKIISSALDLDYQEVYDKYATGNISHWEMESVSFYILNI